MNKEEQSPYSENLGHQYGAGALAFLDTVSGLVPCKVLSVGKHAPYSGWLVTSRSFDAVSVRLTATRGAWKRGETVSGMATRVIPRKHVVTVGGQYRIRTNYSWV